MLFIELFTIFWIACWIGTIVISSKKGEGCIAVFTGFLFGPIALIFAIIGKGNMNRCPFCQELISKKAVKCPHCQSEISQNKFNYEHYKNEARVQKLIEKEKKNQL